jgi:uncharacterized UBP type Zn finger protein
MKVGYMCDKEKLRHIFSYPFWSIGLRLKRNSSIAESIQEYFLSKKKEIQCINCKGKPKPIVPGSVKNFIAKLPPILIMDIQFFDESGGIIKKNF